VQKRGLYGSRREREFYSYYESVLAYANTEPKFCDLRSPEAVAAHRVVTSSDTTRTAFVQLAAPASSRFRCEFRLFVS
jgi:hypothetical protein